MNNAERQSIYPPHAKPRALTQRGKTSSEKIKHMIFSLISQLIKVEADE